MPDNNPTPVAIDDLPVASSATGAKLVGDVSGTTKQIPIELLAIPEPSDSDPAMNGTADSGESDDYSRADHVHPSDTSRVPTTRTVNGNALDDDVVLTKSDIGLGNVANVLQFSVSNLPIRKGEITLPASGWTASGSTYSKSVSVSGATVLNNSMVNLQPTEAQLAALIADGVKAVTIENSNGVLIAHTVGATPGTTMGIQCTVEEVAV